VIAVIARDRKIKSARVSRENSLTPHGRGYLLGILRLALRPTPASQRRACWGPRVAPLLRAALRMTGIGSMVTRTVSRRWKRPAIKGEPAATGA